MIFTGSGNANKISGIPVVSGTPSDTYTLNYDAASNRWVYAASGSPPGGSVGGGASVAAGQVLYGVSPGVAGSEAAFTYVAGANLLEIGAGIATETAKIGRYTAGGVAAVYLGVSAESLNNYSLASNGNAVLLNAPVSSGVVQFLQNNVERARFAATTGNLLLGTTTDDTVNRLQVAGRIRVNDSSTGFPEVFTLTNTGGTNSGWKFQLPGTTAGARNGGLEIVNNNGNPLYYLSQAGLHTWASPLSANVTLSAAGTLQAYNETVTFGVTQVIVRAGDGQSSTNLQTWQNSAAGTLAGVTFGGAFTSASGFYPDGNKLALTTTTADFASDSSIRFSVSTAYNGTKDLSLSRASANVLQVGDGGSNANGTVLAGGFQGTAILSSGGGNNYLLMQGGGGGSAFAGLSRSQSQLAVFSDYRIGWLSGTNINASTTLIEVGLGRSSSTSVEVNNGNIGTYRDFLARAVRPVGVTVANLPTPAAGMIATVTDATATTIGTTVAGGGANTVQVWYNGTNWRISAN